MSFKNAKLSDITSNADWIQIQNLEKLIQDLDPVENGMDPQHCYSVQNLKCDTKLQEH